MRVQQDGLYKNYLALLTIVLLVGMIGGAIYSVRQSERARLTKLVDGFHKRFLMNLAASIYDVVPIVYHDEKTLSLSAFYPFISSLDGSIKGCNADKILIQVRFDRSQIRWYAGEMRSGRILWGTSPTARPYEDPVQRSRKLLHAYLWGTHRWLEVVRTVRTKVGESARYARAFRTQASCVKLEEKPLLKPLPYNIPRTSSELKTYEAWLCKVLGVRSLTDAWGHPIQLRLEGPQMVAMSAGADGAWGTVDDIMVERGLTN